MSQRSYMLAIRDHLQNLFGLDGDSIDVQFDAAPEPIAGQLAISVHPGTWTGQSGDYDLDETFSVSVTVSMRLGAVPQDRWGTDVLDLAITGLEATLRQINAAIHKSYFVMNMANSVYLGLNTLPSLGIFCEPLQFVDGGRPELKGPDWFGSADYQSEHGEIWARSGVAQTLTFSRARRIQKVFPAIILHPPDLPFTAPVTSTHALPAATTSVAYSQIITAEGGRDDIAETYTFALVTGVSLPGLPTTYSGPLPPGLTLNTNGTISGTPTLAGTYYFRVSATDVTGFNGFRNYSITVT